MAANVLARKQRGLIAVLRRAVDNAQEELEALEQEDDVMQFTPTEPTHLRALKEWSCSYPTWLRGGSCGNCGGPFELDRNRAMMEQSAIIRTAEGGVRERERQLTQLQGKLARAQQYEREDLDMPLARRMKMKPEERLRRDQEVGRIVEYTGYLPGVEEGLKSARAALPGLVEPAKRELQRLRLEVMQHKQEHWPVFAVSARVPEEGADGYICLACACDPLVAYDYKAYIKASYKVPEHVKERWFEAAAPAKKKEVTKEGPTDDEDMERISSEGDDSVDEQMSKAPRSLAST